MMTPRSNLISHDIRREARRRLVVGLSGLSAMLLLVSLANWLTGAARQEAEIAKAQAQAAGVANPGAPAVAGEGDPLAGLGVAPTLESSDGPAVPSATPPMPRSVGNTMVVPDLRPDPQIEAPKARR